MGNSYSKWHDTSKAKDLAPTHLTLFLPVFGLPNHVEAFILSSTVPYPDDPLFGAFILSPWFEQVPNKLSNEEFLEKYKSTDRYADNYLHDKKFIWNPISKAYELSNSKINNSQIQSTAIHSVLEEEQEEEHNLIELATIVPWDHEETRKPDEEPEGLHYRPKRFDLDTLRYPIILSKTPTSNKSNQQTEEVHSNGQGGEEFPSHVPFFKIGLPYLQSSLNSSQFSHSNEDTACLWKPGLYPYQYSHQVDRDSHKVLPFKGLGIRQKFSTFDYNFEKDKQKPYTGLGGDGIKTEYDLFSPYKYPRKSLISVRAIEGYSLDTVAYLTHVDTIPAHHLGTVLILDMVNENAVTILSQFITKTLEFLQHGCILPLTNVDIWVLQLNGDKLDNLIMENDFIREKLIEIGFDFDKIHLYPYEISPFYALPPPLKQDRLKNYPFGFFPLRAFPILSKRSLTHFLTPIWNAVYLKTFQLHQEGHWDRLVNRSIKTNPKIKFIPPNIFPTCAYQSLHRFYSLDPKLLKKQFLDAIKGYDPYYHHTDDQAISLTLTFAAMYRTFQIKAMEYFGPVLIQEQKKLQQKNQKKSNLREKSDGNDPKTDALRLNSNDDQFTPAYELLFNDKEPLWDNPRSYFPHIKKISQFIQNPKPLHFLPEYNHVTLNNARPLPKRYKAPFVKKLARLPGIDSTETESDHEMDDNDNDEINIDEIDGKNNKTRNKKIYPRFYTSQSIWPTAQTTSRCDHTNTIHKDHALDNNKNDNKNDVQNKNENLSVSLLSTQITPLSTLSDQIISFGLPKRYEFESFILWAEQPVIADQHNMFEVGYFYEPHVQAEIIQAVDRIKFENTNRQAQKDLDIDIKDPFTNTFQETLSPTLTLHPSSHHNLHSVKPTTILETLLPPSLMPLPSKTDYPTPFQYLLLTNPNTISRYYPSNDNSNTKLVMPMWSMMVLIRNRLRDLIYSRLVSRLLGHLHPPPKNQYHCFHTPPKMTIISLKHMVPPVLRQKHYTLVAPLSYAHTRVEFGFSGGDGKIDEKLIRGSDGEKNDNGHAGSVDEKKDNDHAGSAGSAGEKNENHSITTTITTIPPSSSCINSSGSSDSLHEQESSNIEIGLTYLHRCITSATSQTQDNEARRNKDHCFYASHPLISSISFLPLAWLHGIYIIPFVYIGSRTKLMQRKFNLSEGPIFLNRPICQYPYPTNTSQLTQMKDSDNYKELGQSQEKKCDLQEESQCGLQEESQGPRPQQDPLPFSPQNNTFRSYPIGFIPPLIPPFPTPGGAWSRYGISHGITQNNHAKTIVDTYQKELASKNSQNSQKPEHLFPFTIPLVRSKVDNFTDFVPGQYDNLMLDPCHSPSYTPGQSSLPSYHSPMTFIVLITNPIYPDPVPYSNIEIPHQVMGSEDLIPIEPGNEQFPQISDDKLNQIFLQDVSDISKDIIPFSNDELDGNNLDNIYDGYEDEIPQVRPYFIYPSSLLASADATDTTDTTSIPTTINTPSTATTATTSSTPGLHATSVQQPGNVPQSSIPSTSSTATIDDLSSTAIIEDLSSLVEPITQSQFRYYQEYIPILYKRQLTEQLYGHGLARSTAGKLQKLWTVEVHTPQTIKAAMKRIERSAIETRLKLYRDLALCLQHDDEEKRKKAEAEERLF